MISACVGALRRLVCQGRGSELECAPGRLEPGLEGVQSSVGVTGSSGTAEQVGDAQGEAEDEDERGPGAGQPPALAEHEADFGRSCSRSSERSSSSPSRAAARERRLRDRRRSSVRSRVGRRSSTSSGDGAAAHARRRRRRTRPRAGGVGQDVRARRGARGVGDERPPGATAPRWRAAPRVSSRRAPASRARASRPCSRRSSAIRSRRCARRSVLVVDEAGMLPTRELAQLVERVRGLDVKLVLVGDHRQLAAIGPGGAFRALMDRLPVIELEQNRRQVAEWEREALRLVREGARARGGSALRRRGPDRGRRGRRRAAPAPGGGLVGGARSRRGGDDRGAPRPRRRPQRAGACADACRGRARCRGGDRRGRVVLGWRPRRGASQRPRARRRQRRSGRGRGRRSGPGADRPRAARGPGLAAARLSRAPDSAWPSRARARLRDHRASRPGHDLPPYVHPRDGLAHARGRLRRAEPRQGEQPDLRDRAGRSRNTHGAKH